MELIEFIEDHEYIQELFQKAKEEKMTITTDNGPSVAIDVLESRKEYALVRDKEVPGLRGTDTEPYILPYGSQIGYRFTREKISW